MLHRKLIVECCVDIHTSLMSHVRKFLNQIPHHLAWSHAFVTYREIASQGGIKARSCALCTMRGNASPQAHRGMLKSYPYIPHEPCAKVPQSNPTSLGMVACIHDIPRNCFGRWPQGSKLRIVNHEVRCTMTSPSCNVELTCIHPS